MFHAWFYLLSCVLSTLWSTFHMISWTNLLTRATVPAACFLLFLVPGKSENEYSRNWTGQKPKCLFFRKSSSAKYETEKGQRPATPPGRAAQPAPCQGVVWSAQAPPLGLSFRLYIALGTKTLSARSKIHERVCSRRHLHP